jgi:hypothetical protein
MSGTVINMIFQKLELCLPTGEGMGDTYSVGSIRNNEPQSLDSSVEVSTF